MEFSDVVRIEEIADFNKANKFLDLGWKLLAFYKTVYDDRPPGINYQYPHHVLGWIDGEPEYPADPLEKAIKSTLI